MKILEERDERRYKEFLEKHERCNFQQSLEWGKVKTSWKKEVILSEDKNGQIRGSLCVWIRKIPIFGNLMYSARGPVCDIHDEDVIKDLTEGAKVLAQKYNAFVLPFLCLLFPNPNILPMITAGIIIGLNAANIASAAIVSPKALPPSNPYSVS